VPALIFRSPFPRGFVRKSGAMNFWTEWARTLRGKVNWDHHADILLVRTKGGGPLMPNTKEKELWTFSANRGDAMPGPLIRLKTFATADLHRKFLHLGIWQRKLLQVGGFAPADTARNDGNISSENPPRFIH